MNDNNIPHSIDHEEGLLGAMLLSTQAIAAAQDILDPEDFYSPSNGTVYAAILELYRTGKPVDPVTVSDILRRDSALESVGGQMAILSLQAGAPVTSHAAAYAETIANHSARRKLIAVGLNAVNMARDLADPGDIMDSVSRDLGQVILPTGDVNDPNLWSVDDWLKRPQSAQAPWVIKGLFREGWRVMVIATEGGGKTALMHQIALASSQGVHPFNLSAIPPVKTLVVDLENPDDRITAGFTRVHDRIKHQPNYTPDMAWLWHEQTGINIRKRVDRARLEKVIQQVQPQLVCIGPMYKLYSTGSNESDENAVREVQEILDDLRRRYRVAFLMEHHAPKEQSGYRAFTPYGSSLWLRWPEFGLALVPDPDLNPKGVVDPKFYKIDRFRMDRTEAHWPDTLEKTGVGHMPWTAAWKTNQGFVASGGQMPPAPTNPPVGNPPPNSTPAAGFEPKYKSLKDKYPDEEPF